jgi:hypothetical protein
MYAELRKSTLHWMIAQWKLYVRETKINYHVTKKIFFIILDFNLCSNTTPPGRVV